MLIMPPALPFIIIGLVWRGSAGAARVPARRRAAAAT